MALQRLLSRPSGMRAVSAAVAVTVRPLRAGLRLSSTSTAPSTVVDTSFWKSLVPKPLRRENRVKGAKAKEWNPATFFIVMFLFIGSMSIQMIALRNSTERYLRQSTVRIALLREVVEKIQKGEDVDVEKVLGTGDPEKEADWEEMLQAIERDDATRKASKPEKPLHEEKQAETSAKVNKITKAETHSPTPDPTETKAKPASFGNFF